MTGTIQREPSDAFPIPHLIEWLCLACGLYLVYRYFWIFDDVFVYLRYIDNLIILKIGLVYNQGEYVEGFSSPLYLILLALFRVLHCQYLLAFHIISYLSFTAFWLMLVLLNRRLSPKSSPVINFPLIYLSFNYAVLSYFSSGIETPLIQMTAIAYALYILNPSSRFLWIFLALSPLIRHEFIIPMGLCAFWSWIYHKKFPLKMLALSFVLLVSWMVFRVYYYADFFPNTFYLKDIVWFKQGFIYLHQTLYAYHFYSVFVLFLILILLLKKKGVNLDLAKRLMILCTAIPLSLYVVKIGGDARHYRYLAFPFCLTLCAFGGVLENFILVYCPPRFLQICPLAGIVIALIVFTFYPPQLDRHPLSANVKHETIDKIMDSARWRREEIMNRESNRMIVVFENMTTFIDNNPTFEYEETLVSGVCVGNYNHFDKRCINWYGLTDGILARVSMKSDRPSHKLGLLPLAHDLAAVHDAVHDTGKTIGPGMYRKFVENGGKPLWIAANLKTIEIIEKKIYNNHDFVENMRLAFYFPEKINYESADVTENK